MTNQEIFTTAMRQSAIDCSCKPADFLSPHNIVVESKPHPDCRRYLSLPFFCNLITYGTNVVASVHPDFAQEARSYIDRYTAAHCFETPNFHVLNDALQRHGMRVCFMAEYFLPDPGLLKPLPCGYETRLLTQADFAPLYLPQWKNALCEARKHLDILGVGAYDGAQLIGLAACSADCDTMWQIGIDVLPQYRRQGVAAALTSRLALEIVSRGKVPFYCAAWSNLPSVRNAIRAGFRPAWVEMTAKRIQEVTACNQA